MNRVSLLGLIFVCHFASSPAHAERVFLNCKIIWDEGGTATWEFGVDTDKRIIFDFWEKNNVARFTDDKVESIFERMLCMPNERNRATVCLPEKIVISRKTLRIYGGSYDTISTKDPLAFEGQCAIADAKNKF